MVPVVQYLYCALGFRMHNDQEKKHESTQMITRLSVILYSSLEWLSNVLKTNSAPSPITRSLVAMLTIPGWGKTSLSSISSSRGRIFQHGQIQPILLLHYLQHRASWRRASPKSHGWRWRQRLDTCIHLRTMKYIIKYIYINLFIRVYIYIYICTVYIYIYNVHYINDYICTYVWHLPDQLTNKLHQTTYVYDGI